MAEAVAAADLLSFIEACRSLPQFDALLNRFHDLIRPLGFDYASLWELTHSSPDLLDGLVFSTFRPEWLATYARTRQNLVDPVWHSMLTENGASIWSQNERGEGHPQEGPLFFRSIGLADGMTIPVYASRSRRAVMFLGATRSPKLDFVAQASVTLACNLIAARGLERRPARPAPRRLTEREREILTWTALGRSAREISGILDLSHKTVARHLLNIRLKLSATNTVQAVALAMSERIIVL